MKAYGKIKTNLVELCKKKGIKNIEYEINSLMFETVDGEYFNIDFEENCCEAEGNCLKFKLEKLGSTFEEDWYLLDTTSGVEFEEDVEYFNNIAFNGLSIYFPDIEDEIDIDDVILEIIEFYLEIEDEKINFEVDKSDIEVI